MNLRPPDIRERKAIESYQLNALRALLAELPDNPFYAPRLAAAGLDSNVVSLDDFRARLPYTFKHELAEDQRNRPPYGTNLTYPLERYTRYSQTSATTGRPLRWLDTPESWDWMVVNWMRVFEAANTTPRDRVFFAFSFGPFIGFWVAFNAAERMRMLCIPGGGLRTAARLDAILDSEATILCCTPTYAIRLAEVAAEEKISLASSKIRIIVAAGEPGASIPATRAHIESAWNGARVVDHHGMTETGPVTYECPERRGVLHAIEAGYICEVIHPETGAPVAPGETGELVLTTLGRAGSPLLRYRTGDLVRPSAESRCACGSDELALEGGIIGRTDDMLVVRGVNVYPSAVEDVLRSCGVAEYRVEVGSHLAMSELKIEIEPTPGKDAAGLVHAVEAALRNTFALRVSIQAVPPGTLPRFEMKARRWVKV
jgi:phenylacetate-CoA ligase